MSDSITPKALKRRLQSRIAASHHRVKAMEQRAHDAAVNTYNLEIFQSLTELEQDTKIAPGLIHSQPQINVNMRPILFDFLMDVHNRLKLSSACFYLTVSIIDRYCSLRIVRKDHFQLLGLTSLWLAAKFIDPKHKIPSLDFLRATCCNCYNKNLFLEMECHILKSLNWEIDSPTHDSFIDLILKEKSNELDEEDDDIEEEEEEEEEEEDEDEEEHYEFDFEEQQETHMISPQSPQNHVSTGPVITLEKLNNIKYGANYLCQLMQFHYKCTFNFSISELAVASVIITTNSLILSTESALIHPSMSTQTIRSPTTNLLKLITLILTILRETPVPNSFKTKFFNKASETKSSPILNSLYTYAYESQRISHSYYPVTPSSIYSTPIASRQSSCSSTSTNTTTVSDQSHLTTSTMMTPPNSCTASPVNNLNGAEAGQQQGGATSQAANMDWATANGERVPLQQLKIHAPPAFSHYDHQQGLSADFQQVLERKRSLDA